MESYELLVSYADLKAQQEAVEQRIESASFRLGRLSVGGATEQELSAVRREMGADLAARGKIRQRVVGLESVLPDDLFADSTVRMPAERMISDEPVSGINDF